MVCQRACLAARLPQDSKLDMHVPGTSLYTGQYVGGCQAHVTMDFRQHPQKRWACQHHMPPCQQSRGNALLTGLHKTESATVSWLREVLSWTARRCRRRPTPTRRRCTPASAAAAAARLQRPHPARRLLARRLRQLSRCAAMAASVCCPETAASMSRLDALCKSLPGESRLRLPSVM